MSSCLQVFMVTEKMTQRMYAMKAVGKELLHNEGRQSVTQAIAEKDCLSYLARRPHPFIVQLWFAFQVCPMAFVRVIHLPRCMP